MLSAPFGSSHLPPPVLPFLLTQNLSPKDVDIAGQHGTQFENIVHYVCELNHTFLISNPILAKEEFITCHWTQ